MKKLIILLVLPLLFMASSCQIKDANGADNYDLSTYTLEDVKNNNIFKSSFYIDII